MVTLFTVREQGEVNYPWRLSALPNGKTVLRLVLGQEILDERGNSPETIPPMSSNAVK
jgi:hypothetical protein